MFKQLTEEDIDDAFRVIDACRIHLDENHIPQWVPQYPNRESIANDVEKGEIYGYFDPHLKGIIVYHDRQDPEYQEIDWLYTEPVITVHRLAVDPKYQNQGIASKLMEEAEKFAIENRFASIRLDAFSLNPAALRFYEKRNYILSGVTFFQFRKHPFYCYERNLKSQETD